MDPSQQQLTHQLGSETLCQLVFLKHFFFFFNVHLVVEPKNQLNFKSERDFKEKLNFEQLPLAGSPGPSEHEAPCLLMVGPLWWQFGEIALVFCCPRVLCSLQATLLHFDLKNKHSKFHISP